MPNRINIFLLKRLSILLVVLFVYTEGLMAQNYQSVLGTNGTTWNVLKVIIDGEETDSLFENGIDTVINSVQYRVVNSGWIWAVSLNGFLREDTISGKVWYRDLNSNPTTEYLIADFSLALGDSFLVKNYFQDTLVLVDSVYLSSGRKHIRLNYKNYFNEKLTFIEGVGPNYGLEYQEFGSMFPSGYSDTYLLCKYNDTTQLYQSSLYPNDCNVNATGISKKTAIDFQLFPNPISDNKILTIKSNLSKPYNVTIYDICGSKIYSESLSGNNEQLEMNYQKGLYILFFEQDNKFERYKILIN